MLQWCPEPPPSYWPALTDLARKQVAIRPDHASGWLQLGDMLVKSGALQDAAACLLDAASRFPHDAAIHTALARTYRLLRQFDRAVQALAAARSAGLDHAEADVLEFDLRLQMREWERAEALLGRIESVAPSHSGIIQMHVHRARRTGCYEELLAACDAMLARVPGHSRALYCKSLALASLGRRAEAAAIMAIDRFTTVEPLVTPSRYGSDEAFREALAGEIMRNPTLGPDPTSKTMDGSLQSRELIQAGDDAIPVLIDQIRSAVDRYVARLPADDDHPFVIGRPTRVELSSWSMVYPRDARLRPHMHPSGWLSGVTYVSVPRIGEKYQGPLVLGALDPEEDATPAAWDTREIEPIPGRLVLFPSFVPHTTRPTGSDGLRVVVSFDVEPK